MITTAPAELASGQKNTDKIMKTEITTAARKIAKSHNARIKAAFAGNGFLVFGRDGSGDSIKVYMRWERMTGAQAQAQEILDNSAE